tara:strand:+ start:1357 stop:3264 length:1908 start_codon:yes stop_codon:yes gene_type:complete
MGAAGAAGGSTYVDDVFSTYLFNGNSGNQTITNGINFAGEGGMVWCKTRGSSTHYEIADTERGTTNPRVLRSNETDAEVSGDVGSGFTSSGFSLGFVSGDVNYSGRANVSWSFRKAPGFFDMVTWSGNDTAGRQIPHNLGSVPGCIMVKKTSGSESWEVYHRGIDATTPQNYRLRLNSNTTRLDGATWSNTAPTATHFTLGSVNNVNGSGDTYIAYIFAHDEQIFGDNEDQSIIKCGSYIGNGSESNGTTVNLGWEPQWLLIKRATGQDHWGIIDTMRGWTADGTANVLFPNRINSEDVGANSALPTSTGFQLHTTNSEWNGNTERYIYMAIRRPDGYVGKPAEAGTDVYTQVYGTSNSDVPAFVSGFITDFAFNRSPTATENWWTQSRITGNKYLIANSTASEATSSPNKWDYMNGWYSATNDQSPYVSWMWKRHAGFDVVNYKGSSNNLQISHNLGKTPEMIWIKNRTNSGDWYVYHKEINYTYYLRLNSAEQKQGSAKFLSNPTSTQVGLSGSEPMTNNFNNEYIMILLASVDGISKVGSYTGTGASGNSITLGFQPRFLLVKNADRNGVNWIIYDTLRGWTGTDDIFIGLNQTFPQGTTTIGPPTSTGFTVNATNTSLNASGENYIYYAHA